eukprot:TRINITY_DN32893_c0_g1_i3.p7 TRINITY_DN32893_c0_g1~~TRINITY_DN32893_c0_g1_i3.p7  ORF type:complete len:126 (+),score=5.97 TRINITY_DN32893_c0_g1_i3:255-632(+)
MHAYQTLSTRRLCTFARSGVPRPADRQTRLPVQLCHHAANYGVFYVATRKAQAKRKASAVSVAHSPMPVPLDAMQMDELFCLYRRTKDHFSIAQNLITKDIKNTNTATEYFRHFVEPCNGGGGIT